MKVIKDRLFSGSPLSKQLPVVMRVHWTPAGVLTSGCNDGVKTASVERGKRMMSKSSPLHFTDYELEVDNDKRLQGDWER